MVGLGSGNKTIEHDEDPGDFITHLYLWKYGRNEKAKLIICELWVS